MRFILEAEPDELLSKSDALLSELIKAFASNPEFVSRLEKALPEKEPVELRMPVLRELHKRTAEAYAKQLELMVKDIGKVLDRSLTAPTLSKAEGFYDYTKPLADKQSVGYQRVVSALKGRGYIDADFEEGGELYGASTQDLLALMRSRVIEPEDDMHKGTPNG